MRQIKNARKYMCPGKEERLVLGKTGRQVRAQCGSVTLRKTKAPPPLLEKRRHFEVEEEKLTTLVQ